MEFKKMVMITQYANFLIITLDSIFIFEIWIASLVEWITKYYFIATYHPD